MYTFVVTTNMSISRKLRDIVSDFAFEKQNLNIDHINHISTGPHQQLYRFARCILYSHAFLCDIWQIYQRASMYILL